MEIYWNEQEINWIKIIWTKYWNWYTTLNWQKENLNYISPLNQKSTIRNNAINLISWMQNWEIKNNIKYIYWDISIDWIADYETLIVKNWNVIITWNLNPNNKKLWIMVLTENYNPKTDYSNKWNIYIDKDVTSINAFLYSDWWIISSNKDNPYINNSEERTYDLNKQLILNWTLFSNNTIWWAFQLSNNNYILPSWELTKNFHKAMIYDLNYLRKWNKWCKIINNNCKNNEYFIIKYNTSYLKPIWFETFEYNN